MYANEQDIIDKYGAEALVITADHDGDGVADPAVVARGLSDAGDEINTYIGSRYPLPLTYAPPILKPLCIDIALYKMSVGITVTDEKRLRYEDALKLLVKIAEGKITLGLPAVEQPVANDGIHISRATPVLTKDVLETY
jgi:phage gp36-like protein